MNNTAQFLPLREIEPAHPFVPLTLESGLAQLEAASAIVTFDSGYSALDAVLQLLPRDSRILVPESWRAGAWTRHSWGRTIVPIGYKAASAQDIGELLAQDFSAILLETPSDPILEITDIEAIARFARESGALLIVDNSAYTGIVQQPLEHGADVVLYTSLQTLAGHLPTKAGAVATKNESIATRLLEIRSSEGTTLSSGEAWLLLQGLRTFHLRADRAQASARRIAQWLTSHPRVARVFHPHATGHPGSLIHLSQSLGPGWIVGFETTTPWLAHAFLHSLRTWERSDARGCGESTATHPYTGSHRELPDAILRRLGIGESYVRLVVGIEDVDELIEDLDRALRSPAKGGQQEPDWVI